MVVSVTLIANLSLNLHPPLFSDLYMTIWKQIYGVIEGYNVAVILTEGKPVAHYRYSEMLPVQFTLF
jgi:hypothetical protein